MGGVGEEVIVFLLFFFVGEVVFVDFVFVGEGFFLVCFVGDLGEFGLGLRVLVLIFFEEGFGEFEDGFFGVVFDGEVGCFGDFVFCVLRVL